MKKVIPKFRTEEQEARFWDTHSPLDYPGELAELKEPLEFAPNLLKKAAERRRKRQHSLASK